MSKNLETVLAYWAASHRHGYEAAGEYVADGFVWIDHTTESVARTPEEHMRALEEDALWSDRVSMCITPWTRPTER